MSFDSTARSANSRSVQTACPSKGALLNSTVRGFTVESRAAGWGGALNGRLESLLTTRRRIFRDTVAMLAQTCVVPVAVTLCLGRNPACFRLPGQQAKSGSTVNNYWT